MLSRLTIFTVVMLVTLQSSFAAFEYEKELKKIDAYWDKEFVNPNNYASNAPGKFRPMTKAFHDSLIKNPIDLKYFSVCAAYQYLADNFKSVQPAFEKKFGTMDKSKKEKITGMLADSVYKLTNDARKKMIENPGSLQNFFKIKMNSFLERSTL